MKNSYNAVVDENWRLSLDVDYLKHRNEGLRNLTLMFQKKLNKSESDLGKRLDSSQPKQIIHGDLVSQRISYLTRKENPMKLMTNPLTKKKR